MRACCLIVLAGTIAGCQTESVPAPAPDLAHAAPVVPPPPPPPPAPKSTEKGPHAPSLAFAEVEISGQLTLPVGEKGTAHVYVTDGECWKPGMRAYADKEAPGAFFVEAIVPQGSPLWLCAALVPEGHKAKLTWYGSATRGMVKGEGAGEVVYSGLDVPLKKGPPIAPPSLRPPAK